MKTSFTTEDGVTIDMGDTYYYISYSMSRPKLYGIIYQTPHDYKKGILQFKDVVKASWYVIEQELGTNIGLCAQKVAIGFNKYITAERMAGREKIGKSDEELFEEFITSIK